MNTGTIDYEGINCTQKKKNAEIDVLEKESGTCKKKGGNGPLNKTIELMAGDRERKSERKREKDVAIRMKIAAKALCGQGYLMPFSVCRDVVVRGASILGLRG